MGSRLDMEIVDIIEKLYGLDQEPPNPYPRVYPTHKEKLVRATNSLLSD